MAKINLAVMFGGRSGEHEVSLASALAVINSLDKNKYNITPIALTKKGNWLLGDRGEEYIKLHEGAANKESGITDEASQSLVKTEAEDVGLTNYIEGMAKTKKFDLVLPLLHGPYGEDGRLQGMLDMLNVPYLFSGCLASALSMHKHKVKIIAHDAGLDVLPDISLEKEAKYNTEGIIDILGLPIVVKPMELGSSVGMSIPKNKEELEQGIKTGFKHGDTLILEKYAKGRELTIAVIGQGQNAKALPVVEIIPKISGWFDYKAKYEKGGSEEVCPADIPDDTGIRVQEQAVKLFKAVGCRDLARIDFIWDTKSDKFYFIDLNTIPGMTNTSIVPKAAKAAGMILGEFVDKLIINALK